jgi:hypothetical protein
MAAQIWAALLRTCNIVESGADRAIDQLKRDGRWLPRNKSSQLFWQSIDHLADRAEFFADESAHDLRRDEVASQLVDIAGEPRDIGM